MSKRVVSIVVQAWLFILGMGSETCVSAGHAAALPKSCFDSELIWVAQYSSVSSGLNAIS